MLTLDKTIRDNKKQLTPKKNNKTPLTQKKTKHCKIIHKNQNKYVLVFGDSFIGPLNMFNQPNWRLIKFQGATMKGLSKPTNKNRLEIIKTIQKYSNANKLAGVIFCFGTVDVQFSYYYTKLVDKPFNSQEIITGYINFIKLATNPNEYKVGVQLVYPSAVMEENMLKQLDKYSILDDFYGLPPGNSKLSKNSHLKLDNQMNQAKTKQILDKLSPEFNIQRRIHRVYDFNNQFENAINAANLHSINMYKYLVDSKGYVRPKFIDISPFNIHFRWEPQIPYILKEFKLFGITDKYINKAQLLKSEREYLKRKKKLLSQINKTLKKK